MHHTNNKWKLCWPHFVPFRTAQVVRVASLWKTLDTIKIELCTVTCAKSQFTEQRQLVELKIRCITLAMNTDLYYSNGSIATRIVEEWKTNLMSLAILFHFLYAQHVSDINISIIRSLRLCFWITTSVVLFSVRCVLEIWCGWFWVVFVLQAEKI